MKPAVQRCATHSAEASASLRSLKTHVIMASTIIAPCGDFTASDVYVSESLLCRFKATYRETSLPKAITALQSLATECDKSDMGSWQIVAATAQRALKSLRSFMEQGSASPSLRT